MGLRTCGSMLTMHMHAQSLWVQAPVCEVQAASKVASFSERISVQDPWIPADIGMKKAVASEQAMTGFLPMSCCQWQQAQRYTNSCMSHAGSRCTPSCSLVVLDVHQARIRLGQGYAHLAKEVRRAGANSEGLQSFGRKAWPRCRAGMYGTPGLSETQPKKRVASAAVALSEGSCESC